MSQLKRHNPAGIAPAFSNYALGVQTPANARWLYISGQVGADAEGNMAEGAIAQCEQAWRNVLAILADADMGPRDLVKVTAYLTRQEDTGVYREVRDAMLDGADPASTLVIVSALASPDWLLEIEAVAAKAVPIKRAPAAGPRRRRAMDMP
ncbi:MAG: RidA family protein [Rhodovibrionaceae bacterium]|nr:RidA family protein [Rhodovibrionaceae bacterium]